jgi:hypothetical protein
VTVTAIASLRMPSRFSSIVAAMARSASAGVAPVATQPGRSGTYAEKLVPAFSMTMA